MAKIYRYILILILLFIIPEANNQSVYALKFSRKLIRRQSAHLKWSRIDKLMDILKIRPGMTILDIGTGTGQYAYKLAEELKGTGRVFATDININSINYVVEEVQKRGLTNLYPVLVKKEGVDEFYSKHKYDLILIFNVPSLIELERYDRVNYDKKIDYYKKMKDFLTENGRLVLIVKKGFPPFSLDDFTDFAGLIKELSLEPINSPFYKGLRESTRGPIKEKAESEPNELLKKAIVNDFNRMRSSNIYFSSDFLNDKLMFKEEISFSPDESDYANWLLMCFKDRGLFDKAKKSSGNKNIRIGSPLNTMLEALNKLLIVQRFRQYLYNGGVSPYAHSQTKRFLLIKEGLKKVGYKLENEYTDVIPFEVILVFKANKDVEGE